MSSLYWIKRYWILLLQPQQYSYPSIFIYGHRASGKSHVMQVLLKELEVRVCAFRRSKFVIKTRNYLLFCAVISADKNYRTVTGQTVGQVSVSVLNMKEFDSLMTLSLYKPLTDADTSIILSLLHQTAERVLHLWKYYILLKVQKVQDGNLIQAINCIAFQRNLISQCTQSFVCSLSMCA